MRTLTGMGGLGNAQELAELLRQMGRGPDSMLAHITPEEAQMLLESGGSGKINPQTGLPEFQPEIDPASFEDYIYNQPQQPLDPSSFEDYIYNQPQPQYDYDVEAQPGGFYGTNVTNLTDIGFGPGQFQPAMPQTQGLELSPTRGVRGMAPDQFQRFTADDQAQPAGMGDRLRGLETGYREFRQEYPMLERLLTTGAASLPAILQARRARREAGGAAEELRRLGQPLREQGEALRQQALSGGLTPQQARQQEARRAALRQSASQRGGTTGTQQAMIENTLARERSGLAQTNLENALRQLNLANAYDEAAIKAKLQSDRETGDILASIMGDLVRNTAGQRTQPQGGGQQPTQPLLPKQGITQRPGEKR
jgi:hypothetical protein